MNKFVLIAILLCSFSAQAQFMDMLAGTALQGQMAVQGASGYKRGMDMIQQNNILSQLNLLIMDIRTRGAANYKNLNKANFPYNFGPFDWNIGSFNETQFFIELKNVDKSSCNRFVDMVTEASFVKVNSKTGKDCEDQNNIQFIFN